MTHFIKTRLIRKPFLLVLCGVLSIFSLSCGDSPPPAAVCEGVQPVTVRFVAVGDTGQGNQGQLDVAAGIEKVCREQGCDFVVLLGDNIYESGVAAIDDPQWNIKFEEPYKNINVPFYAVLGNHDYGGNGAGNEFEKGAFEVAYSQHSAKWRMPASYYRYTTAAVDLFALDTNVMLFDREIENQKTAFATWVSESKAPWKIAVGHHPYRSNGPHGNAGVYDGVMGRGQQVQSFIDANVCGQADLYISGHDHSQQWQTESCKGTEIVVSGAGASATLLPGTNATQFQSATLGFLYVAATSNCGGPQTLQATFFDVTGQPSFSRTLTK